MPVAITGQRVSAGEPIEVHLTNGTRVLVPCHEHEAIRTVIGALVSDGTEGRAC